MAHKKLYRSISNRKIAGVCGGLGEYLDYDANVFRVIFLVALLLGTLGIWVYLALWLIVPETPQIEAK